MLACAPACMRAQATVSAIRRRLPLAASGERHMIQLMPTLELVPESRVVLASMGNLRLAAVRSGRWWQLRSWPRQTFRQVSLLPLTDRLAFLVMEDHGSREALLILRPCMPSRPRIPAGSKRSSGIRVRVIPAASNKLFTKVL